MKVLNILVDEVHLLYPGSTLLLRYFFNSIAKMPNSFDVREVKTGAKMPNTLKTNHQIMPLI